MNLDDLFVFNGKSTKDFGMYIAGVNHYAGAERDTTEVEIAGRNGTLTFDNGRFKNVPITYKMFTLDINNIDGFKSWLKSNIGYHRLEDTFEPMYYRKAKYTEPLDISATDQKNAAIDITFNCDARRFLKDGDNAIILTGNGGLYNPTYYEALPLIRAYGTGSFIINDITVTITSADQYTDIDCEIMDAYKGATNCNGNIRTTDNKFPVLRAGQNNITKSGISRLEITPRWWTV